MNIETHFENNYITVELKTEAQIEDLREYLVNNMDVLKSSDLLYDLRAFDFQSLSVDSIDSYVNGIVVFLEKRTAKRTALLIASEEALLITRVFKHSTKGKTDAEIEIFFDKEEAISWLSEK